MYEKNPNAKMPSSAALLESWSEAAGAELPVGGAAHDDDDVDTCVVLAVVAATGGSWTMLL